MMANRSRLISQTRLRSDVRSVTRRSNSSRERSSTSRASIEHLSGLDDVLDVRAGSVPAHDPTFVVPHALRAADHPAVRAGAVPQPILDVVGLARLQAAPPKCPGALLIVGVEHAVPRLAVG